MTNSVVFLQYVTDQMSLEEVKRSSKEVKQAIIDIGLETSSSNEYAKEFKKSLDDITKIEAIGEITRDFVNLSKDVKEADQYVKVLRDTLRSVGGTDQDIEKAVGAFHELRDAAAEAKKETEGENVESIRLGGLQGLRRTGSALTQLGLPGGQELRTAGNLLQVAKQAQVVQDTLNSLGKALTTLPGLLGQVATEAYATSGGMGSILAVGAPLAAALLAMGLAFKGFVDTINKAKQDAEAAENALKDFYHESIKLTTQDAQAKLDGLLAEQKAQQKFVDDMQVVYDSLVASSNSKNLGEAIPATYGAITTGDQLNAAKTELGKTTDAISLYTEAIKNNGFAANDSKDAIERARKAAEDQSNENLSKWDDFNTEQLKESKLVKTGSSKQIQAMIEDFKDELNQNEDELTRIHNTPDSQYTDKMAAREKQLQERDDQLNQYIDGVYPSILRIVEAREKEVQAGKDQEDMLKRVADTQEKYNTDKQNIEDKAAQQEIQLLQQKQDKILQIRQKELESEQDALRNLTNTQSDDLLKYNRDNFDASKKLQFEGQQDQIKAQRTEVDALHSHLDKLAQIRKQDKDKEFQFLLDRNFLGLLSLERDKTTKITEEDKAYTEERNKRQQHLREESQDKYAQYLFDKEQRQTNYEREKADIVVTYNRKIEDLRIQENRTLEAEKVSYENSLRLLGQKTAAELAIRQNMYNHEILMAAQTSATIQAIETARQAWLVAQAQVSLATMNGIGGVINTVVSNLGNILSVAGTVQNLLFGSRAGGGFMPAGMSALVNDGPFGREGFNGTSFPPGLGVFTAFQSGNVNRNMSANQTNHFYGQDLSNLNKIIDSRFIKLANQIMT